MILRKLCHRAYRYLFIFIGFIFLFILCSYDIRQNGGNVFSVVLLSLSGVNILNSPNFTALLFYITPYILTIYIFSDFMRNDFFINYAYVFTRMGKKDRWLRSTSLRLQVNIAALFLMLEIIGTITGIASGLKIVKLSEDVFFMLIFTWLLNYLAMFGIILFQNVLSLRLGSSVSFLLTTVFYMLSLYLPFFLPKLSSLWRLMLPINQMYILHSDRLRDSIGVLLSGNPINDFPIWFSVCLLLLTVILTYQISKRMLLKSDLSDFIKEVE